VSLLYAAALRTVVCIQSFFRPLRNTEEMASPERSLSPGQGAGRENFFQKGQPMLPRKEVSLHPGDELRHVRHSIHDLHEVLASYPGGPQRPFTQRIPFSHRRSVEVQRPMGAGAIFALSRFPSHQWGQPGPSRVPAGQLTSLRPCIPDRTRWDRAVPRAAQPRPLLRHKLGPETRFRGARRFAEPRGHVDHC